MLKTLFKIAALAVALLSFCAVAQAQAISTSDLGRGGTVPGYDQYGNQQIGTNPFEDLNAEEGQQQQDTTPKKPRKPLESYLFDDSTKSRNNFAWTVDMFANKVYEIKIDTLLDDFQVDYRFLKEGVGSAYLGNLGGATIPLDYHSRPDFQDFEMSAPFYSYIYTPATAPYYNVKKPYTRLQYIEAGQKRFQESNFSVIHAQSVTPSTGFNITYHTEGTKGIYQNQRTKDTGISLGVDHTGKRYTAHAGAIFNTLDMRESGGVIDDWHITDGSEENDNNIPMWFNPQTNTTLGARNLIKSQTYYTVHSYGFPLRRLKEADFSMADVPAFYLGYAFQYDRWSKKYTDLRAYTGNQYQQNFGQEHYPTQEYYQNWYINDSQTRDSIFESKITNRAFIQMQPWDRDGIVGTVDAGVGMDIYQYYMFEMDDFLTGRSENDKRTSYYIYGSVEGKFRRYFDWGGKLHFVPVGYRQGDLTAEANAKVSVFLRGKPISLSGRFEYKRAEPSYWKQNYFSNHFKWSNSADKEDVTRLEVKLAAPDFKAEAGFYQSLLNNTLYYGAEGIPVRSRDVVSVTGVYARKDFRIAGLHLNHRVLLQWSTNQAVVPVPLVSAYLSYFYELDVVKNVLRVRLGVDARYNTSYYAPGYNPAIAQFYNQREMEIGNYPVIDVFLTAKWKRMRIILKYAQMSEMILDSRDYFTVPHYPLNKGVFKIGLSWSFYD